MAGFWTVGLTPPSVMSESPRPGDVFAYRYLWKREERAGELEGRKLRPACVAVVAEDADGATRLFIAPITTRSPRAGDAALEISELEASRAGLDAGTRSWVIVSELNVDVWERSYALEDRAPIGAFSPGFTRRILGALREIRAKRAIPLSRRT